MLYWYMYIDENPTTRYINKCKEMFVVYIHELLGQKYMLKSSSSLMARNQGWTEVWHWCRHVKYCEEKANDKDD